MKDKKILKELRLGPMKSMKDDEYAMIEEEVNQKGIAGLKGYAKSMVEKSMREMAYSMKDRLKKSFGVEKHGEHDQGSHGSWAGNGKGGKNIQDMSMSDQKEFITRMSSAKSYEDQRKIIAEFQSRNSSKPKLNDVSNDKYNTDDSEGEDSSEPKNYKGKKPKISYDDNDTEGEFETNADDPKWMDDMDILRPPKRSPK